MFLRKKNKIGLKDILIVAIVSIIVTVMYAEYEDKFNILDVIEKKEQTYEHVPYHDNGGLFSMQRLGNNIVEFRVNVDQEFIDALNSAIPQGTDCKKVRYKKVPLKKILINGQVIPGKSFMRYRGYCSAHWKYRQKSLKIQIQKPLTIGYKTFNLNSFNTDPFLFEMWSSQLFIRSGSPASRIVLAKLYINGKYDGIRFLSENLDKYLIENQGFSKGNIYRERTHAEIGSIKELNKFKDVWKKNAGNKNNWLDLKYFNQSVMNSVVEGNDEYKRAIDIKQYVNYNAILAITGTNHVNNHNIPIYRPRNKRKFIFIGYDLGGLYGSETSMTYFPIQTPYLPQNWLSRLFWSDKEIRTRIHKRISDLLASTDYINLYNEIYKIAKPYIEKDLKSELIFDSNDDIKNITDYSTNNSIKKLINNRVRYLQQGYLKPISRITPDWRSKKRFQLAIEGLGIYKIRLVFEKNSCQSDTSIDIKVHDDKTRYAVKCRNGVYNDLVFMAERNDVHRSKVESINFSSRNSIGAILVDFMNHNVLPIDDISIESIQTGKKLPAPADWPFVIEKINDGLISYKNDSLTYSNDMSNTNTFFVFNLNKSDKLDFIADREKITIKRSLIDIENRYEDFGPVLCWNLAKSSYCYEFTQRFMFSGKLYPENKPSSIKKPLNTKKIDNNLINNCNKFIFTKGNWKITNTLIFSKNCHVSFKAGAILSFGHDSSIIIKGKASFPKTGEKVVFTAFDDEWGGVVFLGENESYIIDNIRISKSNEFYWNGQRFTGGLNIINSNNVSVTNSFFVDNFGDDALNIKSGRSVIHDNIFLRNRDAIDIDVGASNIYQNLILASTDDGIDLGSAKNITIRNNVIKSSGDKGVSVGEGAYANLIENIIEYNNVGIAIKDGSKVSINNNFIRKNKIGISIYNKWKDSNEESIVTGNSWLYNNNVRFKSNGKVASILKDTKIILNLEKDKIFFEDKITKSCSVCNNSAK